jgi:hypothetical protein
MPADANRFLGPIEPTSPELLRQFREEQEWLSNRDNLERYAGQVVAVWHSAVWGHGPDHATAVRSAEKALAESSAAVKPTPEELAYVVVPDLVTPDSPLSED